MLDEPQSKILTDEGKDKINKIMKWTGLSGLALAVCAGLVLLFLFGFPWLIGGGYLNTRVLISAGLLVTVCVLLAMAFSGGALALVVNKWSMRISPTSSVLQTLKDKFDQGTPLNPADVEFAKACATVTASSREAYSRMFYGVVLSAAIVLAAFVVSSALLKWLA